MNDMKACRLMGQGSMKGVNQRNELPCSLQGDSNLGVTNRNEQSQQDYRGYIQGGFEYLHSCSRLKCIGELMLIQWCSHDTHDMVK
jgi:hypothetical protein